MKSGEREKRSNAERKRQNIAVAPCNLKRKDAKVYIKLSLFGKNKVNR